MNKEPSKYGFHLKDKRHSSLEIVSGAEPRFEDSIYLNKNKVKVIRDILANQKHRQVLTKYVLLAKDPCLKADNEHGATDLTVSPLRVSEPRSRKARKLSELSPEAVHKFKSKQEFTDEQIMTKAHHMFLNSNAEDSYYIRHFNQSPGQAKIDLPHKIPISDNKEEATVHRLRQRIRLNKFDNFQYDPVISH